jgi:hypothetical protein
LASQHFDLISVESSPDRTHKAFCCITFFNKVLGFLSFLLIHTAGKTEIVPAYSLTVVRIFYWGTFFHGISGGDGAIAHQNHGFRTA